MRTHRTTLAVSATALLIGLAGCGSSDTSSTATSAPVATSGTASPAGSMPPAPTPSAAPSSVPPLGKDINCFDHDHCYLHNPRKLDDEQLKTYFATVPGAHEAPAKNMRPWAYVVLGVGEQKLSAVDAPRADATKVTDEIGILNHRALFAYCTSADGRWTQIEPITANPPAQVWMSSEHLVPYGHDGHIPTC